MKEKQNTDASEVIMTFGGKPEEASVSLRIFGDDLDPDEITQLLNCQPTEAYKKGHVITTTIRPRTVKTGKWFLKIKKNSHQNIEEQVSELFEKLPKDQTIWKNLHKRFDVDIFCGAWLKGWNRDVYFSANFLKQMTKRGLSLKIAIYCDCDDEEVEVLTEELNKTTN